MKAIPPFKGTVLTVENLTKSFGKFRAVNDVSFKVLRSDVIALIGPNGAGKSTCLNLINGQLKPDAGRVLLGERDITGKSAPEICRIGVGRTFQIPATFGSMTVVENVQMAMIAAEGALTAFSPPATKHYRGDAMDLLEEVGMSRQAERTCGELAYGELKRVELAIAMAHNPRVLLMDEPTAGMAPAERFEFMESCVEMSLKEGVPLIFTEHDMDIVFGYAGRLVVLHQGQVIAEGSPGEVRDNDQVRDVYLGVDLSLLEEVAPSAPVI